MSARRDLLDALDAVLPATFRVSDRVTDPDQIDTGTLWVMASTNTVAPGPTLGLLTIELQVRLLSPAQDPGAVDDSLDDGLDTLMGALLGMREVVFKGAERGVTPDDRYHGYTLTVHRYATFTDD